MTITTDHELDQLRDALRGLLGASGHARGGAGTAMEVIDRDLWHRLALELGLPAVGLPQRYGGGYGPEVQRVVMEELGGTLARIPFLSSVVLSSSALIASADDTACDRYLPRIAEGQWVAALAIAEHDGQWSPRTWTTYASQSAGRWRLTGEKAYVVDGAYADLLLVFATTEEGLSLFAVDPTSRGVVRQPMISLDLTRTFAVVSFDDVGAELIGRAGTGELILSAVKDSARLAMAAENVGGAARCLQMSVDYAKTRQQFGRPIGSFQAIKHLCAGMLIDVEGARAATCEAAAIAEDDPERLPAAAAIAFVDSARAYFSVTQETIHVHGGIGFTWEHPAHLYFRRAKSNQLMFGGPATDYDDVLTLLGV